MSSPKTKQLLLLIAAVFLGSLCDAFAQVPPNDNLANKWVIVPGAAATNGTTLNATREANEVSPTVPSSGRSVWFDWTPAASGSATLTANAGGYRVVLAIWTGTSHPLTQVAATRSAAGGANAAVTFTATAGVTYKVMVDSGSFANGPFTLTVPTPMIVPAVALTSPSPGQFFTNPAPITLSATASSANGPISSVTFYRGATTIATLTSAPYTFTWNNPPAGSHAISATATDSTGVSASSGVANISVLPAGYFFNRLIGSNSVAGSNTWWRYKDDGSDQGIAWVDWGFNDSSWKSGPGELGYGDGDEATVVEDNATPGFNAADTERYITTYFRTSFTVTNAAVFSNLTARFLRDDGVVAYLNGQEVIRSGVAVGHDFTTLAANDPNDGRVFINSPINTALLTNGINVFAAEIHQATLGSSDITWYLELLGEGAGPVNSPPSVGIATPTNGASFFAPASIVVSSTASDSDGTVTNVDFLVDGVRLNQRTAAPYNFIWNAPSLGAHVVQVNAADDGGAIGSASASVVVYDASGRPLATISSPASNAVFDAPTNLLITANAYATSAIANVQFVANGTTVIGTDVTSPFSYTWTNAASGTNFLTTVVSDVQGRRGTSAPVRIVVNAPPPNTAAPFVFNRTPAAGSSVGSLTAVQVTFSERVSGVDAADLLVNGAPASGVSVSGESNYTFTVNQPGIGPVNVTWAAGHGIQDLGFPALAFNGAAASNTWSFTLSDLQAPTITSTIPAANSSLTNLTQLTVNFSEAVSNVDASDLLVNGNPATGISGSGATRTFDFAQPGFGVVNISWGTSHGITDTSSNPFNSTGAGATWSYTLQGPTILLVDTNANYRYWKGFTEASTPTTAWRTNDFDDASWTNGNAPFAYDSNPAPIDYTIGAQTLLPDMAGASGYLALFQRHTFNVSGAAALTNVVLRHRIDDGVVVWLNGVEIFRINMGGAGTEYSIAQGANNANDPAGYASVTIPFAASLLREGANLLAVQGQNANLGSSDFITSVELSATLLDPLALPPAVASLNPPSGNVFELTNITVRFSEAVQGINAADLLVNGVAATGVSGQSNLWTWTFPRPSYGTVNVTWAGGANISDFDVPPKPFTGSSFSYTLLNPSAPTVVSQNPAAASTISSLTAISVSFNEPVTGVGASDLLINGAAATGLSGSGANYTFTFLQPAYGPVNIGWASAHGIRDTEPGLNAFNPAQAGNTWSYTLVDQTAPFVAAKNPVANANVTNLTSVTVTFSEGVQGVNANDLLLNGNPATGVSGGPAIYTFTFAQPNTSVVGFDWAVNHGIMDLATIPNSFDRTSAGATWQYFTPDNVPPTISSVSPPAGATVRDLTQIAVTFAEPVTGVNATDLRINNLPAQNVSGSAAGPYTFTFTQPVTGAVEVLWASGHGITDLASPANSFGGGEWNYLLNPNAVFADKIVINEIMYLPPSKGAADEWIELRNTDTAPVNVNGWRFTKGVNFTLPNVSIPAGGYLVVAANVANFQAKYPGVTNVVGPWTGSLGNNGENVQLETAVGETVNELNFATEGDWAPRQRGTPLGGFRGWVWANAADGFGPSLELINAAMPNQFGQNWSVSLATNGTPGVANSVARTNGAPLILDITHSPVVPRSTDPVVVSAKILDERTNGLNVTLLYRSASTVTPPAFTALTMFDDGAHNDGVGNDRVWAATIPAQADKTVIEFVVRAVDADNNTNYWPAVAYAAPDQGGARLTPETSANALYQVDDTVYTFTQPLYKLIMTEQDRRDRDASTQNAEFNGTFISIDGTGTELRYNASFRERGAGSRGTPVANQRVNIPTDRRWKGQREFNLNSLYTHAQYAGYLLARKAGLDTEFARIVRVHINGTNNANSGLPQFGCYIHVEAPGGEMATAHWPLDDTGNVYRISSGGHTATLGNHQPPTSMNYSNLGYLKASNSAENDYSDLTNLTYVLNVVPNSNYEASVRAIVNVDSWLTYFAVNSLLENSETSIGSGRGDDSGLYHAFKEDKWYFIAHDWDTVLGQGDSSGNVTESIFIATALPSISRFLRWPAFEAAYYAKLRTLATTVFSPAEVARTLDEGLSSFAATANIQAMKQFNSNRVAYILSQLPPDPNALNVAGTNISGTVGTDTVFASSNATYFIASTLTVASGATLTIQPGVTVRLSPGANLIVANGGRLLAEGTAASPILFTRSGASGNWGNIVINGAVGSPESRIAYARIEFNAASTTTPAIDVNAGTAVLDHLTFGNTGAPYIHVDGASFVISHCEFPTLTGSFEPVHGTLGVKSGGRGLFYRNWFGKTIGYNDSIDFTGGNRPGSPIVQFVDNVFTGSDDDILDLDGTDAWVEGNIFLHAHRNGSPDSASAVSGGNDSGQTSEITIINNVFYDVDQAATAKQGNFYTFINNTVVRQSGVGSQDAGVTAVFNFADEGIAQARGMYVEGNIIVDAERLTRHVTNGTAVANATTFQNNLMPFAWAGPGSGNSTSDPMLKLIPALADTTNFTNWASAQVMRDWFSLRAGSPALGTGPNGVDKGGVQPIGVTVQLQNGATTNDAVLTVGVNRTGSSIPATGFPNGSGYTHYKWRLDGGSWSAETPIGSVINLPGFKGGVHRVDVTGKRDSGMYQDDADWGQLALPTTVFNRNVRGLRINEVLASNQGSAAHEGTFPDVIELYNPGSTAVDLSGLRLTDDVNEPDKFSFDPGTMIPSGGYLVVYANEPDGTSGIHTGFGLSKDGQSLYLFDTVDHGGVLIDTVTFGLQLTDYSIGRVGTNWVLCEPSAGRPNIPAATGDPAGLVINEILASAVSSFPDDFVEVRNPLPLPVAMGGLFFTDNFAHWPNRSPVSPLTFIGAGEYLAFRADGDASKGADHLDFALEAERGLVALLNVDYSIIDCVIYGPQTTDISQGRVANNIYDNNFFTTPTPGAPNPGIISTNSGVVLNEILAANSSIAELDGSTPDWIELYNLSATSVNLGDYSLSDSSLLPRKYVFAPGTVIAGNGYLRLRCDGTLPASTTNTGFNIKAEGGSLFLFDRVANGGALLNAVTYGLQAVDFSISRVPNGTGAWTLTLPTPGAAPIPASMASATSVRVNEWMPNPNSGEDWFELWNPNPQPVSIGGYYTSDDSSAGGRMKSQIPALSYLGASTNGYQRFWADGLPTAGANHANFKLNNGAAGESVAFSSPSGALIDSISYVSPVANVSEGRFPDGAATLVRFPGTESPGDPNYLLLTNVVINEALTHTDPPLEDAIELRNLTGAPINISNWWLSDARGTPRKYRITNAVSIPANGYVVIYEYEFNNDPTNNPNAFSLSSAKGDEIYLSTGDASGNLTGYRTSVDFGAARNGVSFGRYVTSEGRSEFVAMTSRSLGQDDPGSLPQFRTGSGMANPYPSVGPVVISQIMYHPPDVGTNDVTLDEFIELRNITGAPVALFDNTNTWRLRDAVDFDFPPGVSLAAGAKLLVVSFDPVANPGQLATFRGKYGVPGSVAVYGPYTGKLANDNDKVELYRPDNPDAGFVPYVLADRVHYFDAAPWPVAADNTGWSLQRVSLTGFGNDVTNWVAAAPAFGGAVDSDGDGMSDAFEIQYSLNPNNPADANLDNDADGATNLQEFFAGTSPISSTSVLRLVIETIGTTNSARVSFLAMSNRTYTVTYKNTLSDPGWTPLFTIPAMPFNRDFQTNLPVPLTPRLFRLRTP